MVDYGTKCPCNIVETWVNYLAISSLKIVDK